MSFLYRTIFSCIMLLTLPACISKQSTGSQKIPERKSIFITIPQSAFVFENIAPYVYTALVEQFRQKGYKILNAQEDGSCLLVTTINELSPIRRYISPDVLLFNATLRLELTCTLYASSGNVIKEKTFTFSTLLSKPKCPTLNSAFFTFEYKKLLRYATPQIELYFRQFLI